MVQWMDVNQLSQEENLHSKCVCISQLPLDLCNSEELTQLFSETYKPVFCQVGKVETDSQRAVDGVVLKQIAVIMTGSPISPARVIGFYINTLNLFQYAHTSR